MAIPTEVWNPIISGFVGLLGVFMGAGVTLRVAKKQLDADEATRYEERRARWLPEKKIVYDDLRGKLEAVHTAVSITLNAAFNLDADLDPDWHETFGLTWSEFLGAKDRADIVASHEVLDELESIVTDFRFVMNQVINHKLERPKDPKDLVHATGVMERLFEKLKALDKLIRRDLQMDDHASERTDGT